MAAFFPAKILLFGEYSIVIGGQGLAIPLPLYGGNLAIAQPNILRRSAEIQASNDQLRGLLDFLTTLEASGKSITRFNLSAFENHVRQGLYFNSSIPEGYGLGSSGAVCAAVYFDYALNSIPPEQAILPQNLVILRQILAQMETYFHGASSGIDPLVAYTQKPILIGGATKMQAIDFAGLCVQHCQLFLYDTGKVRPAKAGLVPLFIDKIKSPVFKELCQNQLNQFNQNCINALFEGDTQLLARNFEAIAAFEWEHFQAMIPDEAKPLWLQGLQAKQYYLKLCGAGGGGFMLGFTQQPDATLELLGLDKVQWIEW